MYFGCRLLCLLFMWPFAEVLFSNWDCAPPLSEHSLRLVFPPSLLFVVFFFISRKSGPCQASLSVSLCWSHFFCVSWMGCNCKWISLLCTCELQWQIWFDSIRYAAKFVSIKLHSCFAHLCVWQRLHTSTVAATASIIITSTHVVTRASTPSYKRDNGQIKDSIQHMQSGNVLSHGMYAHPCYSTRRSFLASRALSWPHSCARWWCGIFELRGKTRRWKHISDIPLRVLMASN